MLGDCLKQTIADTGFRTCFAFGEHVRAVADHGQNAIITNLANAGCIGLFADQRINVDLPIASMHHRAQGRMDRKAVWLSNRVGQGDIFNVKRADLKAMLQRHFVEVHLTLNPTFAQLIAQ